MEIKFHNKFLKNKKVTYSVNINKSMITSQNCTPLQLLPNASSGGDHVHIPMTLGITTSKPPHTPDFAGKPTYKHSCLPCSESIFNIL